VLQFLIRMYIKKWTEVYIRKYYLKKAFWTNKEVEFALAELGNDAGIYGAAKLALG